MPEEHVGLYRRRRPETSVLYRALAHHFEEFLRLYDERFQRTFGFLRSTAVETVHRFLDCGIFRHLPFFDTTAVERLFRAEVLRLLVARGKITEEVVDSLLAWRHSGFSVHGAVRVESRQDAARLGRYMIRCPIVLERLEWDEHSGEVVCPARPGRTSSPYGTEARWDVLDFIAHVVDHVPERGQQLVRYWGWYSNAARGKRRRAEATGGEAARAPAALEAPPTRRRRFAWAKLIRLVYEVDPLLCEYCGCRLRIMAFLTDHREARRFLAGIGEGAQTPEPLAHSPPGELELVYEPT